MTSNSTLDKVAVVTGASSGIGAATVRALSLSPSGSDDPGQLRRSRQPVWARPPSTNSSTPVT